jgi:carboxyl-terminal processing protease
MHFETAPSVYWFVLEMKFMKKILLRTLSYLLVATLASTATFGLCQYGKKGKLEGLQNLLEHYFIEDVDKKAVEDAAAAAMVDALDDRWSYYQSAEEHVLYQNVMSNTFVGVGITISLREDGQGLDILEVTAGGPAQDAGVLSGDRLIKVDGTDIQGMTVSEVSTLIKGEEGTFVELTLIRAEEELKLSVERKRINSVVATGQLLSDGIGLITIANFDERCAQETIAVIQDLRSQGAEALIFDVRYNPGGYKREMVALLDYLLPEGDLFRTVDYRGREQVDTSDASCLEMPMAVIMNLYSYSAAEFFAAALNEYDAAVTVGEKTYGKGYFQNTFEFRDGSAVTLSIGKYYTPKGVSLAGVGLTPEVEVALTEEEAALLLSGLLPVEEDPQIQAAINALKAQKAT